MQAYDDDQEGRLGLTRFPTMDDLLQMRRDPTVYGWFCRHFMLCVVGSKKWLDNCHHDPMHVFVTVSDEAFALTQMQNSYDTWMDMYKRQEETTSDVRPKFTHGGKSKKGDGRSRRFSGWSDAGLTYYNVRYDAIGRNRQQYPDFDNDQMAIFVTEYGGVKKRASDAIRDAPPPVQPRHDMPWNPVLPPVAHEQRPPGPVFALESESDDDDDDEEEEESSDGDVV